MSEGTLSGTPKPDVSAGKKFAFLFACGSCVLLWSALGIAAIAVMAAKLLGYT